MGLGASPSCWTSWAAWPKLSNPHLPHLLNRHNDRAVVGINVSSVRVRSRFLLSIAVFLAHRVHSSVEGRKDGGQREGRTKRREGLKQDEL